MKPQKQHKTLRLAVLCWLAALLLAVLAGGVRLIAGKVYESKGLRPTLELTLPQLTAEGVRPIEEQGEGWFISSDSDPKLIYEQELWCETVRVQMHRTKNGTPPVLYWKKPGQTDFSEKQAAYGIPDGRDCYLFDLGGVRVSTLRLDPDSEGGVSARLDGIMVNPPKGVLWYWTPSARTLFLLLTLPPLLAAALLELKRIFQK